MTIEKLRAKINVCIFMTQSDRILAAFSPSVSSFVVSIWFVLSVFLFNAWACQNLFFLYSIFNRSMNDAMICSDNIRLNFTSCHEHMIKTEEKFASKYHNLIFSFYWELYRNIFIVFRIFWEGKNIRYFQCDSMM